MKFLSSITDKNVMTEKKSDKTKVVQEYKWTNISMS